MLVAKMDISGRRGRSPFTIKAGKEIKPDALVDHLGGKAELIKKGMAEEVARKKEPESGT